DMITDGTRFAYVQGGDPLMTLVTGIGCSATAVTGACMAVAKTPFIGAVSAMALFASAGEKAGKKCQGPGSFLPCFIDELYSADYADAAKRVTME
ncbi:MAG TPA: hydroxyethylthiazole kinase, partial [Desulfovibrio sp.]|nr:hydroxyethylthiazole kinase [Desulfovibrio sp.]